MRKKNKYEELLAECSTKGTAKLITIEVGSRGFLNLKSFQALYEALNIPPLKERRSLEMEVVKTVLHHSHIVWCKRNWREN